MNVKRMLIISAVATLLAGGAVCHAKTISFSGYTWDVRPSGTGGPGPNYWDEDNVSVDDNGYLHLRLTQKNHKWYCSEVSTQIRLGFGRYQFWVSGRVDKLHRNVVFGLFNYPTSDVGPDATHEIDIEFAKWGDQSALIGNYTVWPTTTSVSSVTNIFPVKLRGSSTTHRFTWSPTSVFFQSLHGHYDDDSNLFYSWLYQPLDPGTFISQEPMPVYINLWHLGDGLLTYTSGRKTELVVRAFKFTPM